MESPGNPGRFMLSFLCFKPNENNRDRRVAQIVVANNLPYPLVRKRVINPTCVNRCIDEQVVSPIQKEQGFLVASVVSIMVTDEHFVLAL